MYQVPSTPPTRGWLRLRQQLERPSHWRLGLVFLVPTLLYARQILHAFSGKGVDLQTIALAAFWAMQTSAELLPVHTARARYGLRLLSFAPLTLAVVIIGIRRLTG